MKEDKNIDKLIRESLKVEQPPVDFTDKIMNQIQALDSKEDMALGSLIKKSILESPSVNFTDRIMVEVKQKSLQLAVKPVISKKIWIVLSVFISVIFIYTLFTGESNSAASEVIDGTMNRVDGLLTNSLSFEMPALLTSPLFGLSVFALSSLLFLDYFIKNKKISLSI